MANPPTPLPSPTPIFPNGGDQGPEEDTGEFKATHKWVKSYTSKLTVASMLAIIGLLAALGSGGKIILGWLVRDAVAQDGGVTQVKDKQKELADAFSEHLKDDAQSKREQKADTYELRKDVKALYETIMSGQRSERLERPIPPPPTIADAGR